jgi:hypothetical protein
VALIAFRRHLRFREVLEGFQRYERCCITVYMATSTGYSGTPLFKKLGYRDGMTVVAVGMPAEVRNLIEAGTGGIRWSSRGDDVAAGHIFATKSAALRNHLNRLRDSLRPAGFIWVSWPKRASGVPTDITENLIREIALPLKLVDIKVCAVTEVWSGLKLVIPVKDRK